MDGQEVEDATKAAELTAIHAATPPRRKPSPVERWRGSEGLDAVMVIGTSAVLGRKWNGKRPRPRQGVRRARVSSEVEADSVTVTIDDAYRQHNIGRARRRLGHFGLLLHSPRVVSSPPPSILSFSPFPYPRSLSSPHPALWVCARYKFATTLSPSLGRLPIGILYSCRLASSSYQIPMVT